MTSNCVRSIHFAVHSLTCDSQCSVGYPFCSPIPLLVDFWVVVAGEIVHPSAIWAIPWVLRHTKHAPVSGPLHFLLYLFRMFFLHLPVWVTPSLYPGLCAKSFYQKVLPSQPLLKQCPHTLTLSLIHHVLLPTPEHRLDVILCAYCLLPPVRL